MRSIEPRCLPRAMTEVALFDATRPAAMHRIKNPSAAKWRLGHVEPAPCLGVSWVFDDSTKIQDSVKGRLEAAVILSSVPGPAPPPLTRRMRHDRMRARVETRVALLVPWIDARQAVVDPVALDEESRHSHDPALGYSTCLACPSKNAISVPSGKDDQQ